MKRHAAMPALIYDFPVYWTCDVYEDTLGAGCFPHRSASHPGRGKASSPRSPRPRPAHPRQRAMDLPEQPAWAHVAQTYAWVLDQSFAEMARKNEDTVRWIHGQQDRARRERVSFWATSFWYDAFEEGFAWARRWRRRSERRSGSDPCLPS